ncbi:MAG: guanylate kinase [Desulfobacteraceae bacterium]|nr:guanylate kinase [Desulfobacteraceae bacterium]
MGSKGKLFIVSAPSGAGKTTLTRKVLKKTENLSYSVSHTTRLPRINETHGVDYFFIDEKEFLQRINDGLWLEWAKVHDNYYGTSKGFINEALNNSRHILLDIDVQGAQQVMASGMQFVSIYIMPPSFEELEKRLRQRGTDTADVIEKRLENAKKELDKKDMYQYVIVNDDLDKAITDFVGIFEAQTQ